MIRVSLLRACLCLAWFGLAALSFGHARAQPTAEEDAIYAYTDDRGALVHAQRLQDVPLHLRRAARRVDLPSAPASGKADQLIVEWLSNAATQGTAAQEPGLYRYRAANGRQVYTNLESSIPPSQRAQARVDLSHVPLNSELGNALNQKLHERFEALSGAQACAQLRSESELSWWQRAWRDQRVVVVCACALLLLLLCTPWMHARGWGSQWARVLYTGVPLLGFVALSASMLIKANASLSGLEPRAQRCQPKAFEAAPGLPQRFSLVSALESEQQALAQIEREGAQ